MSHDSNQTFITQDGSSSLMSGKFGEAYHSRYGAIDESQHVFINAGLRYLLSKKKKKINLLEIGFGTGLNALLTLMECKQESALINYNAVEAYPISIAEVESLNYADLLATSESEFIQLHDYQWNIEHKVSEHFKFTKYQSDFESFYSSVKYDLIYFDAFAPSIQPHLWEYDFLSSIYDICNQDAALVTYCAKGSFKRALKKCGFKLESLPGPAKKREMTRAIKIT